MLSDSLKDLWQNSWEKPGLVHCLHVDPSLSPLTFLYLKSLSIVLPSSVFPLIASSSQWDSLAPASLNISRFGLLLFFTPFFGFGGLPSDGSILPAQPPSALPALAWELWSWTTASFPNRRLCHLSWCHSQNKLPKYWSNHATPLAQKFLNLCYLKGQV